MISIYTLAIALCSIVVNLALYRRTVEARSGGTTEIFLVQRIRQDEITSITAFVNYAHAKQYCDDVNDSIVQLSSLSVAYATEQRPMGRRVLGLTILGAKEKEL